MSADFRLEKSNIFKKWYKLNHKAKKLIKYSLYSVSEFVKNKIKGYKIIGNPGCYPTSIQLPLMPLIKNKAIKLNNIIIDSKSGYSGAGKNLKKFDLYSNEISLYYTSELLKPIFLIIIAFVVMGFSSKFRRNENFFKVLFISILIGFLIFLHKEIVTSFTISLSLPFILSYTIIFSLPLIVGLYQSIKIESD